MQEIFGDLIFTISLPDTQRAYLILYSKSKFDSGLLFNSSDILVASGSTEKNIIIFLPTYQNYFRCAVIEQKIVIINQLALNVDPSFIISSIMYINLADLLILITSSGELLKESGRDNSLETLDLQLFDEKCLAAYMCNIKGIIIINTGASIRIYNFNFKQLYYFKFNSNNLILASFCNQLLFYEIDQPRVGINLFELNQSEIDEVYKIAKNLKKFSARKRANLIFSQVKEIFDGYNTGKKDNPYKEIYQMIEYVIPTRFSIDPIFNDFKQAQKMIIVEKNIEEYIPKYLYKRLDN